MTKRILGAILVASLCAIPLSAQSSGGLRYVTKMELQQVPGDQQAGNPMTAMVVEQMKKSMFPEGPVEMEFLTDGQSVRTEIRSGSMMFSAKGSIMLYGAGQTDPYVLNPAEKTYYVMKTPVMPAGITLPKPEIAIKPTGTFETILGYRAEKVLISWRIPIPVPEGVEMPPGIPTEFTMEMENWCATDVKLPVGAMKMMSGITQELPGFGIEELAKSCAFALRSTMKMSMLPGYAIVSNVTSAAPASPGPEMFKLPADYKEVPMPTPKLPGVRE